MTKFVCLLAVIISTLFCSCAKEDSQTVQPESDTDAKIETEGATSIRIHNASNFLFENVKVNTSGGENIYGTVAPQQQSEYKPYRFAYSYAYVKLTIDGKEFVLQPIDYVGEKPVGKGKFTHVLGVADVEKRILAVELQKD